MPATFTQPSNWIGCPAVSRTPYIDINSKNYYFLGFSIGQYPGQNTTTNYSINSNITPIASYVNNVIMKFFS